MVWECVLVCFVIPSASYHEGLMLLNVVGFWMLLLLVLLVLVVVTQKKNKKKIRKKQ